MGVGLSNFSLIDPRSFCRSECIHTLTLKFTESCVHVNPPRLTNLVTSVTDTPVVQLALMWAVTKQISSNMQSTGEQLE